MNVRVTGQTQSAATIAHLRRQSAAMAAYTEQASSGLRVQRASDDPARYAALVQARADGARLDGYAGTAADATSTLDAGVSALGDANQVLVRAKQIAQEGINATTDPQARQALAAEADGLLARLTRAANTQVEGRYLFGGTATDTPPFQTDASGATVYAGAADRGRALIGPGGQTADTRYAGGAIFQSAGADAFAALRGLRDDLRNATLTDADRARVLTGRLTSLDAARTAVSGAVAEQSSTLAGLDALQTRVADLKLTAAVRAGDLEGADYAEAVVKMQEQQGSLQATMAVAAKLFETSLLDFIR